VEKIRRPADFFRSVVDARSAGKAVIALKLGRSERGREAIRSHTGAIAQEAWVYDVAFGEHGVVSVRDVDELMDAADLLAQIPPQRRRGARRIAIVTTSGGVAALASDVAEQEGVTLPTLDELVPRVREHVPGGAVNPLDLTGFVMSRRDVMEELFAIYGDAVDLLVLAWWAGEDDEAWSRTLLEPLAAAAARSRAPFVVTTVEEGTLGTWIDGWRKQGLAFARGLHSTFRAARAMELAAAPVRTRPESLGPLPARPPAVVQTAAGPIVPFAEAMGILHEVGITVAPYVVLQECEAPGPELANLGERLVVKLADVPHRTDLGAVLVDIPPRGVPDAVSRLRSIAEAEGISGSVVVQAMVPGHAEAFAGLLGSSDVGPIVLLGAGGVLVEAAGRVVGRLAPPDEASARALVEEVTNRVERLRGQRPWPRDALMRTVLGLGELWHRHGAWLASADLNPLVVTASDVVAVDALMVVGDTCRESLATTSGGNERVGTMTTSPNERRSDVREVP
jgi:acyl-CoA synthetase (NDP forming)